MFQGPWISFRNSKYAFDNPETRFRNHKKSFRAFETLKHILGALKPWIRETNFRTPETLKQISGPWKTKFNSGTLKVKNCFRILETINRNLEQVFSVSVIFSLFFNVTISKHLPFFIINSFFWI